MSKTWGGWSNPTSNVDLLQIILYVTILGTLALFYKIRDKRYKSHPAIKVFVVIVVIAFAVQVVGYIALLVAGNPDQQTFAVADTDVAGNTTNASITKIAVDGRYENIHTLLWVYPEYLEDFIVFIEKEDVNGNGTATLEVYALDKTGKICEERSKTITLSDITDNQFIFRNFGEMYPEYVINLTYNGSSDLDKVSISRTLNQVVWTSDYAM